MVISPLRGRRDRPEERARPVGQPALCGQSDRDRQRLRADRIGHGAGADRRWRAVAVDDPLMSQRIIGPELKFEERWMPPPRREHPTLTRTCRSPWAGTLAQAAGITRAEMDAWAARSHQRAVAAIDSRASSSTILPLKVAQLDGSVIDFSVDEHPAGTPTAETGRTQVLHPEIEGSRSPRATAVAPTTHARRWRSSTMPTRRTRDSTSWRRSRPEVRSALRRATSPAWAASGDRQVLGRAGLKAVGCGHCGEINGPSPRYRSRPAAATGSTRNS